MLHDSPYLLHGLWSLAAGVDIPIAVGQLYFTDKGLKVSYPAHVK